MLGSPYLGLSRRDRMSIQAQAGDEKGQFRGHGGLGGIWASSNVSGV